MDPYELNEDGTSNLMTILLIPYGAEQMHIPALSTRQIVCSLSIETSKEGHLYKTMRIPQVVFDLKEFLSVLPPEQTPEIIIVWADSSMTMFPVNLVAFPDCRKLLMVGDTHHQKSPLQNLIVYAMNIPFDAIIFMFRQHVHFFRDAGFPNVQWIQGQLTFPEVKPINPDRRREIVLLGSKGDNHPQRRRIVDELEASNYPLTTGFFPHSDAMSLYSEVQISLNISLNGDMNWRPYEVLGAGGFLITDRLSHFSGLDILFEEGEHYISFTSVAELKSKLDYYLENPDECLAIARRGQEHYLKNFSRDQTTRIMWNQFLYNRLPDIFQVPTDERLSLKYTQPVEIFPRIALYETVQEQQRVSARVKLLFLHDAPAISISDCADLPRVEIFVESLDGKKLDILKDVSRYKNISYIAPDIAKDMEWHIVIAAHPIKAQDLAEIYKTQTIIIADHPFTPDQPALSDECPAGFTASNIGYAIFQRRPTIYLNTLPSLHGEAGIVLSRFAMSIGLRDKRVLEIGNYVSKGLAADAGADSWIALAEDSNDVDAVEPLQDKNALYSLTALPDYAAYRARITDLPEALYGQFDLVYSYRGILNIDYFPALLKAAHSALKQGGKLYLMIDPVWSAHDGHNLPVFVDGKGREFSRADSSIPPWGHLLMTEEEMTAHLLDQTDASTASKIISHVYRSPHLNRLLAEDYFKYIDQVPFSSGVVKATDIKEPTLEILKALKKKYPEYSKFDHCGLIVELRK